MAIPLTLAYLRVPDLDDDFGQEAAYLLSKLVADRRLQARTEERQKLLKTGKGLPDDRLHVLLTDPTTSVSVNAAVLQVRFAFDFLLPLLLYLLKCIC